MARTVSALIRKARFPRVLAVYGSVAFGALQLVDILSARLGMSDMLFHATLVLALVALPLVIATAIVQGARSLPANGEEQEVIAAPNADAARSAPAGLTALVAGGRFSGLLTWRRSLLAVGAAFVLLVASASAFMGLRNLGIGPVGSLMAKGVLEQRDPVIVADFNALGADPALAAVVTDGFRIDLSESPVVTVLQPPQVQQTLLQMGRAADAPLDEALALELAQRRGVKAVVAGDLGLVGRGYQLSVRLLSAETGEALLTHREAAPDEDALIPAIDRLSKRLRARIGESLRTVNTERLEDVSTRSLEALRRYTQAVRASDVDGDFERAVALLEDAIRVDSSFAMAHRKLGVVLSNRGMQPQRAQQAFTAAYNLRDRLTDRERYLSEAAYFSYVTFEPDRASIAYRTLLDIDPTNLTALNNLAIRYLQENRLEQAESLLSRALAQDSMSPLYYQNLSGVKYRLGKHDEAWALLDRMVEVLGDSPVSEQMRALFFAARFDYERAEVHIGRVGELAPGGIWRFISHGMLASLHSLQGRLGAAELAGREAFRHFPESMRHLQPLQLAVNRALLELMRDRPAAAVQLLDAGLRDHPLAELAVMERPYFNLAQIYALAGEADQARRLVEEAGQELPENMLRQNEAFYASLEATVLVAEGRYDAAVELLERVSERIPCSTCFEAVLGRAHEGRGDDAAALAAYVRYVEADDLERLNADALYLPRVLERLGALHEQRGDFAKARLYYDRFVDLWRNADPPLQPRVEAARSRLHTLSAG